MAKAAKTDGGIVETIKTVVYALLIAGLFRTLFFQPFWIPSESMKDTLLIGDFVFVNKMAYGYSSRWLSGRVAEPIELWVSARTRSSGVAKRCPSLSMNASMSEPTFTPSPQSIALKKRSGRQVQK